MFLGYDSGLGNYSCVNCRQFGCKFLVYVNGIVVDCWLTEWTWWKIWIGLTSTRTVLSSCRCTSWRFTAKKTHGASLRCVDEAAFNRVSWGCCRSNVLKKTCFFVSIQTTVNIIVESTHVFRQLCLFHWKLSAKSKIFKENVLSLLNAKVVLGFLYCLA